jgi:hypothetical protein
MDKIIIKKEIIALANAIKEQAETIENSQTISQTELIILSGQIQELNNLMSVPEALEPREAEVIPEILEEVQETPEPIQEVEEEQVQEVELQAAPIVELIIETEPIEVTLVEEIEQEIPEPVVEPIPEPEIIIPEIIVPTAPKMVIGINDKFQFMNELFAGKLSEYEKAILQFNTVKTKEEANAYFQRLSEYSNWKENNETVKRLLNLVNNRFK